MRIWLGVESAKGFFLAQKKGGRSPCRMLTHPARGSPGAVHLHLEMHVSGLIDQLAGETDYLIIDLEGSKDQIVTFALSRTDLCIIPLDGSPMEARQAAAAVRLVQTTSSMIRAPIAYSLLFTRTNAAFQTTDERDVRQEMEINNIPTLPTRIAKRAPYTRIFRDGVLLSELPGIVTDEHEGKTASVTDKAMKQVVAAIENARDYAQAVIHALTKERSA